MAQNQVKDGTRDQPSQGKGMRLKVKDSTPHPRPHPLCSRHSKDWFNEVEPKDSQRQGCRFWLSLAFLCGGAGDANAMDGNEIVTLRELHT